MILRGFAPRLRESGVPLPKGRSLPNNIERLRPDGAFGRSCSVRFSSVQAAKALADDFRAVGDHHEGVRLGLADVIAQLHGLAALHDGEHDGLFVYIGEVCAEFTDHVCYEDLLCQTYAEAESTL